MGYGRTAETFQESPPQGYTTSAQQLAPIERIPTWFVTRMLTQGISSDNPYKTSSYNANAAAPKAQEEVATIADVIPTNIRSRKKLRLSPRSRLLVAGAALATLPFAAVTTGCASTGTNITMVDEGIHVTMPSDYDEPVIEAGSICPKEITPEIVAADDEIEDGNGDHWNPNAESPPPAKAKGPAQFEEPTWDDLIKQGVLKPGNIWSVADAVPNQGRFLCYLVAKDGRVYNALQDYASGNPNGDPQYANHVLSVAQTVDIPSSITNGGISSEENGNSNGDESKRLPDGTESAQLIFPGRVTFWKGANPIVTLVEKGSTNIWTAEGKDFSVINGRGKDPVGQQISLNVNDKYEIATLTVTG